VDPLEQVFSDLDAAFEAALERQDSDAADDLALSLRQDVDLFETLRDGRPIAVAAGGGRMSVVEVAADHVAAEAIDLWIFPTASAVLVRPTEGTTPRFTTTTLVEALRAATRRAETVACSAGEKECEGRLILCARDHFVLSTAREQMVVPLASIRWVRFVRGGSKGAL
jgi:hypothetical protein